MITRKQIRERFKKLAIKSDKRLSALRDKIDHEIDANQAKNSSMSISYFFERKRHNHEMIKMIRYHARKWNKELSEIFT
jgi:hypothetical protein